MKSWISSYNTTKGLIFNSDDYKEIDRLCLQINGYNIQRHKWILDRVANVINKLNKGR